MSLSRRQWLRFSGLSAVGLAAKADAAPADDVPAPIAALKRLTEGVAPIDVEELKGRIAKAQTLVGKPIAPEDKAAIEDIAAYLVRSPLSALAREARVPRWQAGGAVPVRDESRLGP